MSVCDIETNGELRLARQIVPDCQIVFDVGTREDDYLPLLNPHCQFHLFEPIPRHFESLTSKTDVRDNVVANCLALGTDTGPKLIYPDTQSVARREHTSAEPIEIQMGRLDDYCRINSIEKIDFLKIDTEGHELAVLEGGTEIVQRATTTIQFEYGGTYPDAGITLENVFDFLGQGWYFYRILPDELQVIRSFHAELEDYQYSNYVASRKRLATKTTRVNRLLNRLGFKWGAA